MNLSQPKVEIIIPTYNRAHVVAQAIESVLTQDYDNVHILLVDDGSIDNTREVLSTYCNNERIRIIHHSSNRGVTAAKNTGLDGLSDDCTYFGILDSDDTLRPDAVSNLVSEFQGEEKPISQVFGLCQDPNSGEITGRCEISRGGLITYQDALLGRFSGEFWQLVNYSLLEDLRFHERASGGESLVWYMLMRKAPAKLSSFVVRNYDRSGSDRVSNTRYDAKAAIGKMWIYRAWLEAFGEDLKLICPSRYGDFSLEAAKWASIAHNQRLALSYFKHGLRYSTISNIFSTSLHILLPVSLLRYFKKVHSRRRSLK